MNRPSARTLNALLAAVGWLLSGAIHELGHAVTGRMAGLRVAHMQPWALLGRVHVQLEGATTDAWCAAINISGMLLSVLTGVTGTVLAVFAARRHRMLKRAVWLFLPMMCQSLAWVVLPPVVALGVSFPREDVVRFLRNADWHPVAAMTLGLGLAGICGAVLVWTFKQGRDNSHDASAS